MSADPAALPGIATGRAKVHTRDRFFLGMTLVMGAIVLTGFFPTLFGRAAFDVPKMPGYLYAHGLIVASWYALLITQASLIANGRFVTHQKLGWAALAYLVLVPVAGMGTQLALPDRLESVGALEQMRPLIETIFWLNVFSSLQFIIFIIAAVAMRGRAEYHKRWLLFASIAIILPAAARLSRWPVWGNTSPDLAQPSSTGADVAFALGTLFVLLAAMIVHDLLRVKKLHRATLVGGAVMIACVLATPVFQKSEWGKAFVWAVS